MAKGDQQKIPKLDLEKFTFSPPGPMGWSFTEYENMVDDPDQIVLNETNIKQSLVEVSQTNLYELPLNKDGSNIEEEIDTPYPYEVVAAVSEPIAEPIVLEESSEVYELGEVDDFEVMKEIEELEEQEEVAKDEEVQKPKVKKKKQVVIKAVNPPKPPWISPTIQKSKRIS